MGVSQRACSFSRNLKQARWKAIRNASKRDVRVGSPESLFGENRTAQRQILNHVSGAFDFRHEISRSSAQTRCALCRERQSRNAGGLSSGIDLALRVVERYYGREVAEKTAYDMEYQGQGWMNPDSNQMYATHLVSTTEHPLCAVCGMDIDPKIAPKSVFKGVTYYFCSQEDKKTFRRGSGKIHHAVATGSAAAAF